MSKMNDEVADLRKKIAEAHVPKDLETRILSNLEEAERLENDISARVHVEQMLTYTDLVVNLPWNSRTKDDLDLARIHASGRTSGSAGKRADIGVSGGA